MMHTDEHTVADVFSENGHTHRIFGKRHFVDRAPHRPQDRGFQEVFWHPCDTAGQASHDWGNGYFDDTYERNGSHEKVEGYCRDVWFGGSRKFIESNKGHSSFLYLHTNAPHGHYRLPLPQWPKEAGKNVEAVFAKIQIAGWAHETMVSNGLDGIVADPQLPEGKTKCITCSYDEQWKGGGAMFHGSRVTLDERFNFFHCGRLFYPDSC